MVPHRASVRSPTKLSLTHSLVWRSNTMNTNSGGKSAGAALSNSQVRAILIAALVCACLSLLLVLITLRWFLIMRRSFRHRLVLHLIISDAFKATWYFVFPIVVFAKGPVANTSNFCQTSGFLLAFAIEASDMAILIIAMHCTLSIMRPENATGEGGLYRYRNWIYPIWLGPPLLTASLTFVNNKDGYVTAGTFCYLPKRPFWYRLALSWVPRYIIISLLLIMYIWIYIYVHIKFRGFDNLGANDSSYDSEVRRRSALSTRSTNAGQRGTDRAGRSKRSPPLTLPLWQPQYQMDRHSSPKPQPWDHMSFITAKPLQVPTGEHVGDSQPRDMTARGSSWSGDTQLPSTDRTGEAEQAEGAEPKRRDTSDKPFSKPTPREQTASPSKPSGGPTDPLKKTRMAIRKQLRYLFIYPLVYIIVWSLPFANHALNYNNYYISHPVYWLSLVSTIMLSLQAGVDSIMFSCSEKPWRRVDASSKFSMPFLRRRSKALLQGRSIEDGSGTIVESPAREQPVVDQNPSWWEAEGRRRNDSVWADANRMSHALSTMTTRMRSRSPQKRAQGLHSRMTSSEQGMGFFPNLEPIVPESAST